MGISKNIEMLRKRNKITQKELSQRLNVSDKTVSSWESGRTEPNIGMIEALCKIFDCTKSELIDSDFSGSCKVDLSPFFLELIRKYRMADPVTQENVCLLLRMNVEESSQQEKREASLIS